MSVTCFVPVFSLRMILPVAWSAVASAARGFQSEAVVFMQLTARPLNSSLHLDLDAEEEVYSLRASDEVWPSRFHRRNLTGIHTIADRVYDLVVPDGSGCIAPMLEMPGKVWEIVRHHHDTADEGQASIALWSSDNSPLAETPDGTHGRGWVWIASLFVSLGLAALFLWW
eukprot:CAMPEP_0172907438 /NCGR_PEP_ID=MMETSP1075-20121228/178834_1 /TAXON_ID=2916 /ORGANISM="Ceratium fusus, Strain PA161109" /LENGTH=169 /DNA_ID=CAMNT_0013765053 /DNA_START=1 /DNA_END=507 /DNA_ORIENTATION=-